MTRKEAIEFLKNMIDRESIGFVCPKGDGDVAVWEYHVTALNMAIKALEQPEIIHCLECKHWRNSDHTCHEHSLVSPMMANEFCSRAERREEGDAE